MNTNNAHFYSFPDTFQQKILKDITARIKKNESVQLVGPPGIGNTLLIDALMKVESINQQYFDKKYKFIILDSHDFIERKPSTLLKLLAMSVDLTINTSLEQNELLQIVRDKINIVCQEHKLIIVFDHIEELNNIDLQPFFKMLYKIYRPLEQQISFIYITQKSLTNHSELENFGEFSRLILQNIIVNQSFNKWDSIWFIKENAKRLNIRLADNVVMKIFENTGGYPRTIKRIIESLAKGMRLEDLIHDPVVDPILTLHLEELSNYPDYSAKIPLISKMKQINTNEGETIANIKVSSSLTKQEVRLLKLFLKQKSVIIPREDGIEAVWGKEVSGVTEHAYDQMVHRLRKKLETANPKVEIITMRGRGHKIKIG